jgi:uncharacterized membrane protein YgdD (TMEM256/DUF423 family)
MPIPFVGRPWPKVIECVTIKLMNNIRAIAAFFMAISVALGAFGAHALRGNLPLERLAQDLAIWETAVQYNFIHAFAALFFASLDTRHLSTRSRRVVAAIMLGSVVVFSGSLYLLVLTNQRWLGAITPIGGSGFILGWCYAGLKLLRESEDH